MKKITLIMVFLLAGCAATSSTSVAPSNTITSTNGNQIMTSSSVANTALIEMTLEELKQFDGKGGRKAYIAVDGFIYDVSASFNWLFGNHNGYSAGRDLTYEIDNFSPHGRSNLSRVPMIGRIVG